MPNTDCDGGTLAGWPAALGSAAPARWMAGGEDGGQGPAYVAVSPTLASRRAPGEELRRVVKVCAGDWDWARRALKAARGNIVRALVAAGRLRAGLAERGGAGSSRIREPAWGGP